MGKIKTQKTQKVINMATKGKLVEEVFVTLKRKERVDFSKIVDKCKGTEINPVEVAKTAIKKALSTKERIGEHSTVPGTIIKGLNAPMMDLDVGRGVVQGCSQGIDIVVSISFSFGHTADLRSELFGYC